MKTERLIVLLIGLIAGLLLCCSCIGVYLALGDSAATPIEVAAPATTAIQADLSEAYLNRMFLSNTASFNSPVPITGGQIDVQPGNRIAFAVDLDTPLGAITATGAVTITVRDGLLDIHIEQVNLGRLPVTRLMRLFRPTTEAEINAEANRQLLERASQAKLGLEALTTDDTTLHVYLASIE
ncbi:MAG: hypothetical protein ACYC5O_03055 [Anaerolineae bacterium]